MAPSGSQKIREVTQRRPLCSDSLYNLNHVDVCLLWFLKTFLDV
jgi:hypothetical protein